jgi:hypothetical protein
MKNETYEQFVEKFELKKTTDDCYTPDNVYNAIADWVCREYGVDKGRFVRPFYPGGDYESFDYKDGDIVVDNPPFSIISKIINFYDKNGIKFFLFAPALTLLSPVSDGYCGISVGASITYENGARVSTSFATNLEDNAARSCPELYEIVTVANKENERKLHRELPKYLYPDNVVTATFLQKLSKYGIEFSVSRDKCKRISALDAQKEQKKGIFGKGLLVSGGVAAEKAAAEKAAAEKENKVCWELSAQEAEVVRMLDNADVVQVVRCEYCGYWDREWKPNSCDGTERYCPMIDLETEPDFFCKYGERKEVSDEPIHP